MLKTFVTLLLGLLLSFVSHAQGWPQPKTAEFKLAITLSQCVDVRASGIDITCLKTRFVPLLGLRRGDHMVMGEFYHNTDGRGFSLRIEKRSTSRQTVALFDLYVDLERHVSVVNDPGAIYMTPYDIWGGTVYGNIPVNDGAVVQIYELGRGDYLEGDSNLRIVGSGDGAWEGNGMPKPSGTRMLRDVLESGKTVGQILEERMAALEKVGLGGEKYRKDSISRTKPVPGITGPRVTF